MEYDKEIVDEMTLALLWLTMFDQGPGTRAWEEFNWEHMNRIYEKGYIDDPKSKARSVVVTKEGKWKDEELFNKHFGL